MRSRRIDLWLVLLIILENLSLFYFFKEGVLSHGVNAVLYFTSSLLFGIFTIYKFYGAEIAVAEKVKGGSGYIPLFIGLAMLVYLFFPSRSVIRGTLIHISYSDIIPAIQIMVKRFLAGDFPYKPMTELGYTAPAGYMPLHWAPFSIAELTHCDYRFVPFLAWASASLFIFVRALRIPGVAQRLVVVVLIFSGYYLMLEKSDSILTLTVEMLIAAYYMLMVAGLNSRNYVLAGLGIGCCLLSRYTIMLWLPLWAFVMLTSGHKKRLFAVVCIVAVMFILFYVAPFLTRDWNMFFGTVKGYSNLTWEWQHLCDNGKPCHLYNGVGFASIFYEQYPPEQYVKAFETMRQFFFAIIAVTVLLLGAWYWFKKDKIDYRIFLMGSFKIYLSVFFGFMMIPYSYLMITGNFVSMVIFAEQARYKLKRIKEGM